MCFHVCRVFTLRILYESIMITHIPEPISGCDTNLYPYMQGHSWNFHIGMQAGLEKTQRFSRLEVFAETLTPRQHVNSCSKREQFVKTHSALSASKSIRNFAGHNNLPICGCWNPRDASFEVLREISGTKDSWPISDAAYVRPLSFKPLQSSARAPPSAAVI